MTFPADLKSRVLEAARAQPSPTRRAGRVNALVLLAIAVGVGLSLFFAMGGFAHGLEGRPVWFEIVTVAGWTLVALWATWGAFRRRAMLGRSRTFLLAVAVATPALLSAFMLQFDWTCPLYTQPWEGRIGLKCLGLGLGMAVLPLGALAYARRASDPVHPLATGLAFGAATGAWAGLFTDLWCPAANPSHIALGHILPIVLLSLLGLALGKWVIGVKPKVLKANAV